MDTSESNLRETWTSANDASILECWKTWQEALSWKHFNIGQTISKKKTRTGNGGFWRFCETQDWLSGFAEVSAPGYQISKSILKCILYIW